MARGATEQTVDAAQAARRRYFPAVEGMRGVAACSVLIAHVFFYGDRYAEPVPIYAYWVGEVGVFVFFAISGFLLYRPFVAARRGEASVASLTPSYLARRFVRIFPAYWVALTLLAIYPGLTGVFTDQWWVSYGLLRIYSPHWSAFGIGPAWTLCVEISFYLALPFFAALLHSRGANSGHRREMRWEVGVLGALALGSIAWRSLLSTTAETEYLGLILPGTFSWFCVGMLIAAAQFSTSAIATRIRRAAFRLELCWPLALVLFVLQVEASLQVFGDPVLNRVEGNFQNICIAGLLLAPAVFADHGRVVRTALANRWIVYLGTVSYGIYLWHLPILNWLNNTPAMQTAGHRLATLLVGTVALSVAIGSLSWYLIEKPLMRRMKSVKALAGPKKEAAEPPQATAVTPEPAP